MAAIEFLFKFYNESTGFTEKWYKSGNSYLWSKFDNNDKLLETQYKSYEEYKTAYDKHNATTTITTTVTTTVPSVITEHSTGIQGAINYDYTTKFSSYEKKTNINYWMDLDDIAYNNHFANGQCQLKVEFNRLLDKSIVKNLPIYPDDITFGATTNYANTEILGRPGPIAGYVNTSDVTTNIVLHLHRELNIPGEITTDKNKIDELISLIQACSYPKSFQDGLTVPIVTYIFGDTIITGKQTTFSTKWSGPKIGNSFMEVTITIGISHVPAGIEFFDDVYSHNPRQFK